MLRSALELRGYRIDAKDGHVGKASDLFFDDTRWRVRYLVVDTRAWLPGRHVLISPISLGRPDWTQHLFPVELTKEQIENSPDVESDRPVSRQFEHDIVDYFDWPIYWTPETTAAGPLSGGTPPPLPARPAGSERAADLPKEPASDPHLRSMREVSGYHIQAPDGEIGHVADFIIDDETWAIRYLVIETRNWLPGRRVILAPDWFDRVDWHARTVHTEHSRDAIKDAPAYNPAQPINRDYEGHLYDYYGRPGYWTEMAATSMNWKM
jgi:hypothetical protein